MNNDKILAAALQYIERGWHVFPLHAIAGDKKCTCRDPGCSAAGKHPRLRQGHKGASLERAKIEEWFCPEAPLSNIGIVTGQISGITVLDIDKGEGKNGYETYMALVEGQPEVATLTSRTGSGGLHLVFNYNSVLKTASNVLGEGIDCRNDNGYIVAPPSNHKTGGHYEWADPDAQLADLPAFLTQKPTPKSEGEERTRGDAFSIIEVEDMLRLIPADDRDLWRNIGLILGRHFNRSKEAWRVYTEWAAKYDGEKGRSHDQIMHDAFHKHSEEKSKGKPLSLGTIIKLALDKGWQPKSGRISVKQFVYLAPENKYLYRSNLISFAAAAVDALVGKLNDNGRLLHASDWLKKHMPATSITSEPNLETDYLQDYDVFQGKMIAAPGAALYNKYRRGNLEGGDAKLAMPFVEHVTRLFNKPGDTDQFLNYMAHRVQKPGDKPRFALLIAGDQGVGKDTSVDFCVPAIGEWNVSNIEASALESQFNEYADKALIRISEASNTHDMSKWAFNENTKTLIAGAPDYREINPKYGSKYSIRMYCGVVLTTNHLLSGIFIPPDDRRYDILECATMEEMGLADRDVRREYFDSLHHWFKEEDGAAHVGAYLKSRNIKGFSASGGQRITEAHRAVVMQGMTGDAWLDDVLNELNYPEGVRSDRLIAMAVNNGHDERDAQKRLTHSIIRLGYKLHRNVNTTDGRWKFGGIKVTIYVKKNITDFDPYYLKDDANEF